MAERLNFGEGAMFVDRYHSIDDWGPISAEGFTAQLISQAQANAAKANWQSKVMAVHYAGVTAEYLDAAYAPLSAQMFEDAIAHIAQHGWCQGAVVTNDGRVCAQGAFGLWEARMSYVRLSGFDSKGQPTIERIPNRTLSSDPQRADIFTARMAEIMDLMGLDIGQWGNVMNWNDRKGRTEQEVVDALMLAAKKLRDEGR